MVHLRRMLPNPFSHDPIKLDHEVRFALTQGCFADLRLTLQTIRGILMAEKPGFEPTHNISACDFESHKSANSIIPANWV